MAAVLSLLFLNSFMMPDIPKEEVRKLDTFSGIGISISGDIYYTPGNSHEITIEGDAEDVDDLITEVKDGFLQVKYPRGWKIRRSKLTIYITSSELDAVKISGSAKFQAGEPITTDEMTLAMSGSGGIQFKKLNADEVDVSISGSGSAELLGGNADEMDVRISGSGKLNAEEFEVNEFSASGFDGVFTGIAFSPACCRQVKFMADYDSQAINLGASALLFNHLSLHAFVNDFQNIVGGFAYKVYLKD